MLSLKNLVQTLYYIAYAQKLNNKIIKVHATWTNFYLLKFLYRNRVILGFSKKKNYYLITLNINPYCSKLSYKNFSTPNHIHYISYRNLLDLSKNNPFNLIILLNADNRLYNAKDQLLNKQGAVLIGMFRL